MNDLKGLVGDTSHYERRRRCTRALVRQLARERRYYIAGKAQGSRWDEWAEIPVWGFRAEDGGILLCYFMLDSKHPNGYCQLPPAGGSIFPGDGVEANQLGLDLDWSSSASQ